MDPATSPIFFSLLAATFAALILLPTRHRITQQHAHPTFRDSGLGLFLGAAFLGISLTTVAGCVLGSIPPTHLASAAFLTMLGLTLFLPALRFHIQLTPTGLLIQTTFRPQRFIPFSDLTSLRYRQASDTHILTTRHTRPYTLSNLLHARPDLLAALQPHLPPQRR